MTKLQITAPARHALMLVLAVRDFRTMSEVFGRVLARLRDW